MVKVTASFSFMRYYTEPSEEWTRYYGVTYRCNHPVYRTCTLYAEHGKGLCVIQQMPSSTVQQRVERNALVYIVLTILQSTLLAMLADFHDAVPRQKIHPTLSCMHITLCTGFKLSTISRIFNHM